MLECEGHIMFRGIMQLKYISGKTENIEGVWLYEPDRRCWYCRGSSYPQGMCYIVEDFTR